MRLPSAAELTGSNPDHPETQSALIARLERELAEAEAEAKALRALAAWINAGGILARRIQISESLTRDRPFYRADLFDGAHQRWNAEHSDLAAAIMDALERANKVQK